MCVFSRRGECGQFVSIVRDVTRIKAIRLTAAYGRYAAMAYKKMFDCVNKSGQNMDCIYTERDQLSMRNTRGVISAPMVCDSWQCGASI